MILLWWTQIIISLSIMKLSLPLDDVRTDWSTCTYFFFSMNLYLDDLGRPMTSTFNPDSIAVSLFRNMIWEKYIWSSKSIRRQGPNCYFNAGTRALFETDFRIKISCAGRSCPVPCSARILKGTTVPPASRPFYKWIRLLTAYEMNRQAESWTKILLR